MTESIDFATPAVSKVCQGVVHVELTGGLIVVAVEYEVRVNAGVASKGPAVAKTDCEVCEVVGCFQAVGTQFNLTNQGVSTKPLAVALLILSSCPNCGATEKVNCERWLLRRASIRARNA